MKLFCIHPGATFSTADVHNGVVRGLEKQGHTVLRYNLDGRIYQSGAWLNWCYRQAKKGGLQTDRPNIADTLYHACGDAILKALHHECEWVIIFSAMYFPKYIIKAMKRAGLKVGIVLTESPYDDVMQADIISIADIAWTHERTSVDFLRLANPSTQYLPHAFDVDIHEVFGGLEMGVPSHDVVFVGTGFQERVDLLTATDWSGIDFGLYGSWTLLGGRSKLRRLLKGSEIENKATAALYRAAKIGLNIYRKSKGFGRYTEKIERAESVSLRAYELAACGLFHFSDYRKEAEEIFGGLVPVYRDAAELRELIDMYLNDEDERRRIASLLPKAVEGHTWDARATQIVNDIKSLDEGRTKWRDITANQARST
jgi:glycosyltransferase involved in cell wall biosynthesis